MKRFPFEEKQKYKIENEPRYLIDKFEADIRNHINVLCGSEHASSALEVKEVCEKNERITYFLWCDIFIGSVFDRRRADNHGEYIVSVTWESFKEILTVFHRVTGT